MLIKVKDLQKGDEFLTISGGFRYWKALEDPKPMAAKLQTAGRDIRYSGLKCSTRMVETPYQYKWMPVSRMQKTYECTPFDHNHTERVNLNWKNIWLVRRDEL